MLWRHLTCIAKAWSRAFLYCPSCSSASARFCQHRALKLRIQNRSPGQRRHSPPLCTRILVLASKRGPSGHRCCQQQGGVSGVASLPVPFPPRCILCISCAAVPRALPSEMDFNASFGQFALTRPCSQPDSFGPRSCFSAELCRFHLRLQAPRRKPDMNTLRFANSTWVSL